MSYLYKYFKELCGCADVASEKEFWNMGQSGTLSFSSHYSCLQNILQGAMKCKDMVTKDTKQWAIEGGHDQY